MAGAMVTGHLLHGTRGYSWRHQPHMKTKIKPQKEPGYVANWVFSCTSHFMLPQSELTVFLTITQPPKLLLLLLLLHFLLHSWATN